MATATRTEEYEARKAIVARLGASPIDTGWYKMSAKRAGRLCDHKLPRHGYEKRVTYAGYDWWIARTTTVGKQVWSIRAA